MARFEIEGIDEFINDLQNYQKKVESLDGTEIPFDKLFNKKFLCKYTSASTFDEFLKQGNFRAETQEEFEAIPDDELDKYISQSTKFNSWDEMLSEATDIYLNKYLQF